MASTADDGTLKSDRGTRIARLLAWLTVAAERAGATSILLSPGGVLCVLYVQRVLQLRADPAQSPGTPDETWIALMVAGVLLAGVRVSATALRGALPRPVGVVAFLGLSVAAVMIALVFIRTPV